MLSFGLRSLCIGSKSDRSIVFHPVLLTRDHRDSKAVDRPAPGHTSRLTKSRARFCHALGSSCRIQSTFRYTDRRVNLIASLRPRHEFAFRRSMKTGFTACRRVVFSRHPRVGMRQNAMGVVPMTSLSNPMCPNTRKRLRGRDAGEKVVREFCQMNIATGTVPPICSRGEEPRRMRIMPPSWFFCLLFS